MDLENLWSNTESKTKLDLETFHQFSFFFLQKALKCHFWCRNWKKNPFKIKLGFRKSLVQYRVQDRIQEKVQDKVGLGKFSPIFFFLQKALKCHVLWRNYGKNPFKKCWTEKILALGQSPRQGPRQI